jgi:hypothetical protein
MAAHVTHCDALPQGVLLYTKAQMAAALQVSVRCVTSMMYRGELSFLKINGCIVRFRPEEALRRLNETSGRWGGKAEIEKAESGNGVKDHGTRDH